MFKDFKKFQMRSSKLPDPFLRLRDPVRIQLRFCFQNLSLVWVSAYGEYNDLVRQVAASRGQQLANWDFEYVIFFLFRERMR
jgi:hypothetical protein